MWHADTVAMRVGLELDALWADPSADAATSAPWRRALDDGCARVAAAMQGMTASLPDLPRPAVVRVGGGASRDPRVRDALASALGMPVEPSRSHEASVLGAAMCAAVAAGWADDPAGPESPMRAARLTLDPRISNASTREA
jgi:sugar (pentulose or hexulose) kinase